MYLNQKFKNQCVNETFSAHTTEYKPTGRIGTCHDHQKQEMHWKDHKQIMCQIQAVKFLPFMIEVKISKLYDGNELDSYRFSYLCSIYNNPLSVSQGILTTSTQTTCKKIPSE